MRAPIRGRRPSGRTAICIAHLVPAAIISFLTPASCHRCFCVPRSFSSTLRCLAASASTTRAASVSCWPWRSPPTELDRLPLHPQQEPPVGGDERHVEPPNQAVLPNVVVRGLHGLVQRLELILDLLLPAQRERVIPLPLLLHRSPGGGGRRSSLKLNWAMVGSQESDLKSEGTRRRPHVVAAGCGLVGLGLRRARVFSVWSIHATRSVSCFFVSSIGLKRGASCWRNWRIFSRDWIAVSNSMLRPDVRADVHEVFDLVRRSPISVSTRRGAADAGRRRSRRRARG